MTLLRDCAWWLWCWSCWLVYTWGPWPLMRGRVGLWLLPWSGIYAYSATWADFRQTVAWNVAGKPKNWVWR